VRDRSNSRLPDTILDFGPLRIGLSRVAGLLMTRNLTHEVKLADQVRRFGIPSVEKFFALDPPIRLRYRTAWISPKSRTILCGSTSRLSARWRSLPNKAATTGWLTETMTVTGKPLLANDPHRPVQIPRCARPCISPRPVGMRLARVNRRCRASRSAQ